MLTFGYEGMEKIHPKGEPTIPSIIFSMLKVTPYEKLINQTMSELGLGSQVTV